MKKIRENLAKLQHAFQRTSLAALFAADPERAARYSLKTAGIFLDYSKNLIDMQAFEQLLELTHAAHLSEKIQDLFNGSPINSTENRPALHSELRKPLNQANTEIAEARQKIKLFCEAIHKHALTGFSNKPFTDMSVTSIKQ